MIVLDEFSYGNLFTSFSVKLSFEEAVEEAKHRILLIEEEDPMTSTIFSIYEIDDNNVILKAIDVYSLDGEIATDDSEMTKVGEKLHQITTNGEE